MGVSLSMGLTGTLLKRKIAYLGLGVLAIAGVGIYVVGVGNLFQAITETDSAWSRVELWQRTFKVLWGRKKMLVTGKREQGFMGCGGHLPDTPQHNRGCSNPRDFLPKDQPPDRIWEHFVANQQNRGKPASTTPPQQNKTI